jgi:hypothetical protein
MKTTYLLFLFLIACSPVNEAFFTPYFVPKGQHYSWPRATVVIPSNYVAFQFKTDYSWDFGYPGEMFISKIGGIAFGSNHTNSVRLGVMTEKDGVERFYFYVYDCNISPQQDKEQKGYICDVEFNKTYDCVCGWREGEFYVKLNDLEFKVETSFRPTFEPRSFCSPYYGGNPTTAHRWEVPIKLN